MSLAHRYGGIRCVLTDIEGTTTDIEFVHNVLFPYSAQHLPQYVMDHENDPEVQECLAMVRTTLKDENDVDDAHAHTCIQALLHWVATDRKHTALKALQGLIWKTGYETGAYQSHVYPDVLPALQRWRAKGLVLAIYSSGSIAAQKLLFAHTPHGDLTPYFSHYFDTTVGGKKEVASYQSIAKALELPPEAVLFLSDMEPEVEAAEEAGMQVIQLQRNDDVISGHVPYPVKRNFDAILP